MWCIKICDACFQHPAVSCSHEALRRVWRQKKDPGEVYLMNCLLVTCLQAASITIKPLMRIYNWNLGQEADDIKPLACSYPTLITFAHFTLYKHLHIQAPQVLNDLWGLGFVTHGSHSGNCVIIQIINWTNISCLCWILAHRASCSCCNVLSSDCAFCWLLYIWFKSPSRYKNDLRLIAIQTSQICYNKHLNKINTFYNTARNTKLLTNMKHQENRTGCNY